MTATGRLLILPHAGSGTAAWFSWRSRLPDDVELRVGRLPGRETRLAEQPLTSAADALSALCQAYRALPPLPTVVFGHSLGALLARGLCAAAPHMVRALAVSGEVAPGSGPRSHADVLGLPDREFAIEVNKRWGAVPAQILDAPEFLSIFLPALRGDLALVDSFPDQVGEAVDFPLFVFSGVEDDLDEVGIKRWENHTNGAMQLFRHPGAHMAVLEDPAVTDLVINTCLGGAVVTFLNKALAHFESCPEVPAVTFVTADSKPRTLTRAQLLRRAGSVATQVRRETAPGDRVLVALPTSADLVAALIGVLMAGRVAVPAPATPGPRNEARLAQIAKHAGCALTFSQNAVASAVLPDLEGEPDLRIAVGDLAVLQYTSGSTSEPKGVRVRTANIDANLAAMERAFDQHETDVVGGWLPLFHDMGLVGNLFHPLRMGLHVVLMSPEHFVRDPSAWLRAISDFGVTTSGGPDFGYAWCADRIDPARLENVDLSRWRVAFTGSEPISARTLERFSKAFGGHGFRPSALTPCYGLAESTLLVSCHAVGTAPRVTEYGVSCGQPVEEVAIVDETGTPVEGTGEIWVRGPSVADGYHGLAGGDNCGLRTSDDRSGWLRTGDLGILRDGELYVRGRSKDLVILRGENHHPHDLEMIAKEAQGVLTACAFSAPGEPERLVLALEARGAADEVVAQVRRAFRAAIAFEPDEVVVLRGRALPRTTSGKLQRSACRSAWEAGELPVAHRWATGRAGRAPSGPEEELLADLWQELLGVRVGSAEASFFATGGASVLAVELSARIAQRLGVHVSPVELLAAGTLEAQAKLIARAPKAGDALLEPDEAPLSLQQEGLWLLSQLSPSGLPPVSVTIGVPPGADVESAVATLVHRHPVLATSGPDMQGRQRRVPWTPVAGRPDFTSGRPFTMRRDGDRLELAWDHSVIDGWSVRILIEELEALLAGRPLSPAPPSALAWAAEQRKALAAGDDADDLAFWRARPSSGSVELPWTRPGVEGAGLTSRRVTDADALRQRARELDTTAATLVLAAVSVVLCRVSGQGEVAVGVPFANRTPPWTRTVGCLVSVQRAFARVSEDTTGTELVRELTQELQQLREHASLPLESLQSRLGLPRDAVHVDVVLDHLSVPARVGELSIKGTSLDECPPEAKVPLTITAVEDEGLRLVLLRQRSFMDDEAADEFVDQVELALGELVRAPGSRCLGWSLRTARAALRFPAMAGPLPTPDVVPIPDAVMGVAPERVALRCEGNAWTYADLQRRALQVAGTLQAAGTRPGDVVGVLGSASFDTVAAALGTMLAGGAVLHLDRRLPPGRLATMVREASAAVVVRADGHHERDAGLGTVVEIGEAVGEIVPVDPAGPAYVVFSTGSTSTPKAIVGTHRGIAHFLGWQRQEFEVGDEDRFVLLTNLAFDMSLRDVWLPLTSGGVLHLLPDPAEVSGERVVPLLTGREVTRLHLVPTLAKSWLTTTEPTPLPALRSVFFAGEPLSDTLVARFREHFPGGYEVLNFYGPSETTQTKIFFRVPEQPEPGIQPIGRPLPQTAVTLLNAAGTLCGVGEPGEILIRTPFATNGYANEPVAQAQRFIPDPLGSGQMAYLSGDLGRVRPDGVIEILGRGDRQVKVHGVAVDPAEVADMLSGLHGVRQAAVRAEPSPDGDHRLVAWFVADRSWSALRDELADRLPAALVPERAMACDTLPVHANGKVDLRALPDVVNDVPVAAELPVDALEAAVLEAWRTTLGEPELDMHADFFAHGGHSLKALELAAAIKRALGRDIPLAEILQARTPRELARRGLSSAGQAVRKLPEIVHAPDDAYEPFPMTPVQEAYWVGRRDFLELGGAAAQTYRELSCDPVLDLPRLEQGFRSLIDRHPSLRTVATEDGRQQVLRETPSFRIVVQDLREASDPEAAVRAWRREMSHRVRLLEQWPLIEVRASLLPDEVRLHVGLDAWACDAWSRVLLLEELREFYDEPARDVPPLEITFRDYVLSAEGAPDEADLEWWRAELDELPAAPRLPLARRTGTGFTRRHGLLEAEAWAEFQRRAGRTGVTPSAALLAAFGWVLARWSAEDELALNVTVFRRLPVHPDVNRLLGDFTSVLPHAMHAQWETFQRHARDVQARLWQELAHGSVSGVHLARELARRTGRLDATGLPVVFTSALTTPELGREFDWSWLGELVHGISQTPQVWLDLQVYEHRGELHYNWDSVEEMFEPGVLDALFETWSALLRTLVDEPWNGPVPELLPETQRLLQARTNATEGPVVRETLADGVLAAAARTPDAPAVIDGERTLSFAELIAQAEQVAAELIGQGVPRGGLVAIVAPHGWRQSVAALGVLLAGAAYVPVDPSQPEERVRQILDEAGPGCVLRTGDSWGEGIAVEDCGPARARRLPEPGDLAYVIYTSGSTGRPKGVVIRHESAVNTLVDISRRMSFGADDRVLALSALAFDLSVWDLFGSWRLGAAVVYPADRSDPTSWARAAHAHGVRVWNSVPALAQMLTDALEADPDLPVPALRTFMLSGDWIPLKLPSRLRAVAPEAAVWSLGGATEASIWSIAYRVDEVDEGWASIPYGRPLTNQTVQVLDDRLQPCPVHVAGRLFIGGLGLASGYWRDEARTAERFLDHDGVRLYDTGDLGRWLPDGTIEILGRVDNQVKIRGYRVELGEIEHALEALPGVDRAAVLLTGDPRGDRRLVGFVVPRPGAETSEAELRRELAWKLPNHMVPHAVVFLDALPLSANGKVDRAALATQVPTAPEPTSVATDSDVLAQAWGEVLGAPPAGPDTNFFAAGGDSVSWLRVCAVVSRTGWRLPAAAIAEDATLRALSTHLRRPEAPAPLPAGPTPPGPMRNWLEAKGLPLHFNQAVVLRLVRELDPRFLDRALTAVVAAHPTLGSTLDGGVGGHVLEHGGDAGTACRGFTADGPLLRATLLPAELVLCAHHTVVDAQSWRVIVGDLEVALDALEAGREPELLPEPTEYTAWCHAVADLPAPPVPDFPASGPTGVEREGRLTAQVLAPAADELRAALEHLRCTEEELLVSAAAWANGSVTGRWDVELERHGRMLGEFDLSRTTGWLTALVPLALTAGSPTDVLVQVKKYLRELPDGGIALAAAYAPSGQSASLVVNPLGALGNEHSSHFELVRDNTLPLRDPDLPRANERRVTFYTASGRLHAELNHRDSDGWLSALETALSDLLQAPGTATASAVDFPHSGLPDDELRALLAGLEATND
ncbi:amino acid adenylation domain-containing protein [Kitasatospora aureofaciens]|nr:amino acid adenylation domain-containing protein [Kitasatospora aureofaciens]